MSYKALYRTYRPQRFEDVTGQDVVVQTLQNAIKNNKISHAYLFSGPRGTGKTSIARIFAKALNCANLQISEPCDECVSCQEISQGYNPDVIEIDAASNNGVDEIRDIREKVKFLPSGAKYKVYIIDEVHMLSGGAFNALLKTLEEPPKHAVFILATTEPQKLPATIISRCQRFEFKALSVSEISERLKTICELENVNISEEALNSISESAEGAMRDALSILDQAISYGNKTIDIEDINGVTGSLSFEKLIKLANSIENKDIHSTLKEFNNLLTEGKEVSKIINSLLVFCRDVLLYKSVGTDGFDKYVFSKEAFKEFASNVSIAKVMYFIDVLCDTQNKVRYSTTPNIFLEISLIKMCNISIEELDVMKRLSTLEEKMENIGDVDGVNVANVSVDNDKVNLIEMRVGQIINELNRLEIRKQIEKIEELRVAVSAINSVNNVLIDKEMKADIQVLKDKVSEIELFKQQDNSIEDSGILEKINLLESKINDLTMVESNNNDSELELLKQKVELLTNQTLIAKNEMSSDEIEDLKEKISDLTENVNYIKEKTIDFENKDFEYNTNENNLTEISEKLMFLEKRIYQIVAGELSSPKITKKEPKKNNGQIMLFGEEVLGINDFEISKEKYDFGDLQKEEIVLPREEVVSEIKDEIIEKQATFEEEKIVEKVEDQEVAEEAIEKIIIEDEPKLGLFEDDNVMIIKEKEEVKPNVVVSQYFDIEKGQEVINKEKSTLVVSEKKTVEESTLEKDIIALETEERSVKPQRNLFESEDVVEPLKTEKQDLEDKFSSYDIKDIEQILHDSRAIEAKNDKQRMEQVWKNMTRGARPEHLSIIETLQSGKIAVVGNKEFIIVFSNVSLCTMVMRKKFKEIAVRILYNLLGEKYDYVALPIDVWSEKSIEYKQQYQIGIKYPTLKPLNIPGLEVSKNDEEYQSENDKIINRTLELFGKGNVEIE